MDGHRADARGGRCVLVDRAERGRTRARSLRACRPRTRNDRRPDESGCSKLVQLRLVPDWARTIARHVVYERADHARLEALKGSGDAELAGLAAKIDREEAYHRMHAQMWAERLRKEPRFTAALEELEPLVDVRDEQVPGFRELWE